MKSPLRWPGGKRRLADMIVSVLPAHKAYVEGCCGGASVFFAKPRGISVAEILNDFDGELINFYYVLHAQGRKLAREVDSMPYSRRLFVKVLADQPRSAFRRAVRFWYLNRVVFGAKRLGHSFGVKVTTRSNVLPQGILDSLDALIERLRGCLFEALDVVRLIELYDRPTTVFYLDPPFYGTSQAYACLFGRDDHERLCRALKRLRGAWLLSYNDCPEIRRLYRGFRRRRLDVRYTMGCNSSTGGADRAVELLISNRPLPVLMAN